MRKSIETTSIYLQKKMNIEEIKALLKRKKQEHITEANKNHKNNTEAISNYEHGAAKGLEEAIAIIGMLDNDHNRTTKK